MNSFNRMGAKVAGVSLLVALGAMAAVDTHRPQATAVVAERYTFTPGSLLYCGVDDLGPLRYDVLQEMLRDVEVGRQRR